MKLRKLLLRYHPPGLILAYDHNSGECQKTLDLLDLTPESDPEKVARQIVLKEGLLTVAQQPVVERLLKRLIDKLTEHAPTEFGLFRVLRAHVLPLTNCAFNKGGDRFITGSYDRTCKASQKWETL